MTDNVMVRGELFASLVARYFDDDILLFKVARDFVVATDSGAWSEWVQFRFVRKNGALVELEIRVAP